MYIDQFRKYVESTDITKIGNQDLTFPSKNCFIHKGKIFMRPGITNDGTDAGVGFTLGERTWKDQLGGVRAVKASILDSVGVLQLKVSEEGGWVTIYDDIDPEAVRVRFETWLDTLSTIIKKRLYFVDGSDSIHKWTGAVATVASIATADITISGTKTLLQLGFDNATAKKVKIVRFETDGTVKDVTEYDYTDTCADNILHLNSTPSLVPVAGDLIIDMPEEETTVLTGVLKDDIYNYKNHLILASLESNALYWSDIETELDYTVPAPGDRTAITPITMYLTGNYTAMISRKDVLWVSTEDEWIKVTKTAEQNELDLWVKVENFEQPERCGAFPFAVAKYKADVIFLAQDRKLQRITTLELTGKDDLMLLSDEVEDLLLRLDMEECRIYFHARYIFITVPRESKLLMLDMLGFPELGIGAFWQPPQDVPISYIQIIDDVRYGHSNSQCNTFTLFEGGADLGTPLECKIAFGYFGGKNRHQLYQFTRIGIDGRMNTQTIAKVDHYFETSGAKKKTDTTIDGSKIKMYDIPDDVGWGNEALAFRAWAGADIATTSLKRFFVFDKVESVSWFEYRPIFTINGESKEFQLLGISLDTDEKSDYKIDSALFISK